MIKVQAQEFKEKGVYGQQQLGISPKQTIQLHPNLNALYQKR